MIPVINSSLLYSIEYYFEAKIWTQQLRIFIFCLLQIKFWLIFILNFCNSLLSIYATNVVVFSRKKCLNKHVSLFWIYINLCHRLYTPNHLSKEDKSIEGIKTGRNELKTDDIQNVVGNAQNCTKWLFRWNVFSGMIK